MSDTSKQQVGQAGGQQGGQQGGPLPSWVATAFATEAPQMVVVPNNLADPPPPLPSLTPLTKEAWKALTSKQRWDVITAMRGPDMHSATLKWLTTSILRFMTTGVLRQEGTSAMVNLHVPFILFSGLPSGMSGAFDFDHFICHVRDAAQILGVPLVPVRPMEMAQLVFAGSVGSACKTAAGLSSLSAAHRQLFATLLKGGH